MGVQENFELIEKLEKLKRRSKGYREEKARLKDIHDGQNSFARVMVENSDKKIALDVPTELFNEIVASLLLHIEEQEEAANIGIENLLVNFGVERLKQGS